MLTRIISTVALVLAGAASAGCYAPGLEPCAVECGDGSSCPDDSVCGPDRYCHAPGDSARCEGPDVTITVALSGTGSGVVTSDPGGVGCAPLCTGAVARGTEVRFAATADASSRFSGWLGACTGVGPCVVTVTADLQLGAVFNAARPLDLEFTGAGGGGVTSTPTGLACTDDCSALFDVGAVVTLTATADATSRFDGWAQDCQGSTCTVVLSAGAHVGVGFVATQALTVAPTGSGTGAVTSSPAGIACGATCATRLDRGASVTLTATAAAGSEFRQWAAGGACAGSTAPTCALTLDQDRTARPTFIARDTLTIAVIGAGAVAGTAACTGADLQCAAVLDRGTAVDLAATPAAGWRFDHWSVPPCAAATGACALTLGADATVTATFVRQHALTIELLGSGAGAVTASPPSQTCTTGCTLAVDAGALVTLAAAPALGSRFAGWQGACTNPTGDCLVTMAAARTVRAAFVKVQVLTVTVGPGGAVTSNVGGLSCPGTCTATLDLGTVVTLVATPEPGARLVAAAGCTPTTTTPCTVTMTADRTVDVTFQGGRRIWSRTVAGVPSYGREYLYDLAADPQGDVVVVGQVGAATAIDFGGQTLTGPGSTNVMVAKYTAAGALVWVRVLGASGQLDAASAVAIAPDGDVVIGGYFTGALTADGHTITATGGIDAFVGRLDGATGAAQWLLGFGGDATDGIRSLAVTPGDHVLVLAESPGGPFAIGTGPSLDPGGANYDVLADLTGAGDHRWSRLLLRRLAGGASATARVLATSDGGAIAVGNYGAVAPDFGGGALAFATRDTAFVVRYAASGAHLWSRGYGGTGPGGHGNNVHVTDAALAPTGDVVIAGWFDGYGDGTGEDLSGVTPGTLPLALAGANDMFVASYRATDGAAVAALRLGSSDADPAHLEAPRRIAIDPSGEVSMVGEFSTPTLTMGTQSLSRAGATDVFFARLAGTTVPWLRAFGSVNSTTERATAVATSASGQVFVAGFHGDFLPPNACTFDGAVFDGQDDGYLLALGR